MVDLRQQLEALVPADFLSITPSDWLQQLPRYLDAALYRLQNLQGKVPRDQELTRRVVGFGDRLSQIEQHELFDKTLWSALRFGLEEVRVCLFAERWARKGYSVKKYDKELGSIELELGLDRKSQV